MKTENLHLFLNSCLNSKVMAVVKLLKAVVIYLVFISGEMVIEYAGELIRSTLTDKREKYYNGKGIGCYMFKIDDNLVVDATMRGNAARFINHACEVSICTIVQYF